MDYKPKYKGLNPNTNPGITTEFATAALRLGNTLLATDIQFLDNQGNNIRESVALKNVFFDPTIINEVGIDSLIKYLATANTSKLDTLVINDVRNFLFALPGEGGLDLVSLNIQRGREHGLIDYNSARKSYKLPSIHHFSEITKDVSLQEKLKSLYGNVNNIDM